jgi:NADPH2:quinone reductase
VRSLGNVKAIRVEHTGGPEVLRLAELPEPALGSGQAVVRLQCIGVNFIDVYQRTGLYPVSLPYVPGVEGAGIVESVAADVADLEPGSRVAFAGPAGAYAEKILAPADRLVPLPEAISFEQGAAAMLQGMTAHFLLRDTFALRAGQTALVHAAAGGVGLLLVQLASRIGARVLATVSTADKAQAARAAGADQVILYSEQDFESEVRRLTEGKGVDVVYDSVGQATFLKSLACLARFGYLVSFGQSSGKIDPLDPGLLGTKGSLFLTRPSLFHYIAERESLLRRAKDVFGWISRGELNIRIGSVFPLADAASAHRALASRTRMGKLLLRP